MDSCLQSHLNALPTFLIKLGYFSHDLSLSFGFLSLVCECTHCRPFSLQALQNPLLLPENSNTMAL